MCAISKKSRQYAEQALFLAQEIGFREEELLAYSNLGVTCTISGDYDRALEHFLDSLKLAEKIKLKDISGIYNNVGGVLVELGEFEQALQYFEKALRFSRPENKAVRAHTLGNMGEVIRKTGDFDRAIQLLEESKALYEEIGNVHDLAGVYYSMGNIYLEWGESEKAIGYFEKSKNTSKRTKNKEGLVYSLTGLSTVYREVGDLTNALSAAVGALEQAREIESVVLMSHAHRDLAAVYQAMGDYRNAYEHQMAWSKIQLDLNTEESRTKIAHLKVQFDVERKENDLRRSEDELKLKKNQLKLKAVDLALSDNQLKLKEKAIALLESENERQAFVRNTFIAGFAAIFLFAYVLFNRYKLNQRANRKLEGQNKEIQSKNEALSRLNTDLQGALEEVKQLTGLLPICAHCKKICDKEGEWKQLETYINEHSDARFSHGICPGCYQKQFSRLSEIKDS